MLGLLKRALGITALEKKIATQPKIVIGGGKRRKNRKFGKSLEHTILSVMQPSVPYRIRDIRRKVRKECGIDPKKTCVTAVSKMCAKGTVERISRGVYRKKA